MMVVTRFEVWTRRKRGHRAPFITWSLATAMNNVDWRRRTIRVRTFYDRSLRVRTVQFLVGDGDWL